MAVTRWMEDVVALIPLFTLLALGSTKGKDPADKHQGDTVTVGDLYRVHAEDVEAQHSRLGALIVDLDEALRRGYPRSEVLRILHSLVDYARVHFADEEQFMQACNYTGFAEHQTEHRDLLEQVQRIESQAAAGALEITSDLLTLLQRWLDDHTSNMDQRYIDSCGTGPRPD